MNYVLKRLSERSTWVGIIAFLSAIGVGVEPKLVEAIVMAGTALAGVVLAVWPDKPTANPPI